MIDQLPKSSEEIVVAEVDIKIRETGKDVDDALFKVAKGVFEVGSILFGGALIYNAFKEKDQTKAIIKGLAGVALGGLGLYSYFS